MTFFSTSTRSVLSAVALAGALALGSGAAVAAPTLQVGPPSVGSNTTAQVASTGDPTAFSQIAHERSTRDHVSASHTHRAASANADHTRFRVTDPSAFGAMAHQHDGINSSTRSGLTDNDRDASTHANHANQYQQPNQAWAS